ncbi:ATP-binding cassette domain-containing protein [Pseudobacteriovorax antillogorgiicola]|uniref:Iron complex transport system ATP-binding protein n=1 Tax=Pseudobacteriovorax antillogorgiicola TaxID=1513793 RepID=A0A1Y6CFE9_9BACT|nr:ATP-binding cassette domain-containing protein [Pseudobacteriovorax antillogorgiicola]TCS49026.1 iron complex transport system ATP-binding protein [Pseudobacteriovorax antillogorgiicola]SMF52840.1 iron complex transport system ATP-binding protein [Pseudobacteriovorax antillogorgiicola]
MIQVQHLSFGIGHTKILRNINLEIRAGEFVAILGPNGSGKTTLMKHLTGDLKAEQGQVFLKQRAIQDYSPQDLALTRSVLEQSLIASFPFIGRQILKMGMMKPDQAAWNHGVRVFELTHLLDKKITEMSGGEVQRINGARVYLQALTKDQGFHSIFLDEPTSALDIGFQIKVMRNFKRLCETGNYAVCAVLHDLNLAKLLADRIVLMKDGRLDFVGYPEEALSPERLCSVFDLNLDDLSSHSHIHPFTKSQ